MTLLKTKSPKRSNQIIMFLKIFIMAVLAFVTAFIFLFPNNVFAERLWNLLNKASILLAVLPLIYLVFRFESVEDKTEQAIETFSEVNQKLDQITTAHDYQETLRKEFLAISSPYIYYADFERLSDSYYRKMGYKRLGKVTNTTDQEVIKEAKASYDGAFNVSGGLGGSKTESIEEEFIVLEPSIVDMLLDVQSDMLRNNQIILGIERGLSEGDFQTSEPNVSVAFDSAIFAEKQRLLGYKRKVLVFKEFALKLSGPDQSKYTLSFTRRIVENIENSPKITFNASFPRNSIADKDKSMFEDKLESPSTIKLILFGQVTTSEDSDEGNISIDISPYAIYLP